MTRIVTYNVHRCIGADRTIDVARVAGAIAMQAPDIVALQELDVGRARTGGVDQAHQIAQRLGMTSHFNAALKVEEELYGDAILTSLPQRLVKAGPLPGHPRLARLEPRGAVWVAIEVDGLELQVINTHLGLFPREQRLQAEALAGREWLGGTPVGQPVILLGDLNATPRTQVYRTFAAKLLEARRATRSWRREPTFPARLPMLAIDHVFVSGMVRIESVRTPRDPVSRIASDHLPLVVDFKLTA